MWIRPCSRLFFAALLAAREIPAAALDAPQCVAVSGGPMYITSDCVDPEYSNFIIDSETDETNPVAHRKVSGYFDNTPVVVNIYLPPKDQWQNRFFQLVYPTQLADATDENIGFAADSGAYWVQITDLVGYRADAAAAKSAREIASQYYGTSEHIYGYIFGGSGGSYQTIGAMENTQGVWDGAVPYIQGVPESNPPDFCVRALAGLVLRGKAAQIVDAIRPGGSGDPYAGLSALEKSVLEEATLMGVPLESWEDWDRVGGTRSLRSINESCRGLDPTYKNDFWNLEGYMGTEQSELGDVFRAALVNHTTTIEQVTPAGLDSPAVITLQDLPAISDPLGIDFTLYDEAGTELGIIWGTLDAESRTVSVYDASNATAVSALAEGLTITVDNKHFLALHTYHRHQLPTRSGFHSFDQFRDAQGNPLYPQRDLVLAEIIARAASGGGTHTGNITANIIVVDTLMDSDAFPWHAVWYKDQVQSALGSAFDDMYRLWYNDHADHGNDDGIPVWQSTQLVPYDGILQYALRELANWVENGVLPAQSTNYTLSESQVSVAETAAQRYGVQPVATLTANGAAKAVAKVGDLIKFKARVETPEGAGKIVSVEWDFIGDGSLISYPVASPASELEMAWRCATTPLGLTSPPFGSPRSERAMLHRNSPEL